MTASVILGACLPQKSPASTARPNPYHQTTAGRTQELLGRRVGEANPVGGVDDENGLR